MQIGNYNFDGPFQTVEATQDQSGVYVILADAGSHLNVVDIGESARIRTRLATHDRMDCWRRHAINGIKFAVRYMPYVQQPARMEVEQALRAQYNPHCGDR